MRLAAARRMACMGALMGACALSRSAQADDRARLAAALEDQRVSSSVEALTALGEEANAFREPDVRIAAWLFVAEGLAERAGRPGAGATYAERALSEPSIEAADRGRAVAVLAAARTTAGDHAGALALAEREAAVVPGLAQRLRIARRADFILALSKWVLAALAGAGLIALTLEALRGRRAARAVARDVLDPPILVAAALVASIGPLLARAFDPAVDGGPFFRTALGILVVHAALAAGRRFLRPALAATVGVGSFVFVAAWAYLGSARPLPAWASP